MELSFGIFKACQRFFLSFQMFLKVEAFRMLDAPSRLVADLVFVRRAGPAAI